MMAYILTSQLQISLIAYIPFLPLFPRVVNAQLYIYICTYGGFILNSIILFCHEGGARRKKRGGGGGGVGSTLPPRDMRMSRDKGRTEERIWTVEIRDRDDQNG